MKLILVKVSKHKFIFNLNYSSSGINSIEINILIKLFYLAKLRSNFSVTEKKPITAEMTVVRVFAEVTAVGKIFLSVFILSKNTLVNPIPNKATLQTRVFIPKACIFVGRTARVTHSVSIFAQNIRSAVTLSYSIFLTFPRPCIHL